MAAFGEAMQKRSAVWQQVQEQAEDEELKEVSGSVASPFTIPDLQEAGAVRTRTSITFGALSPIPSCLRRRARFPYHAER